MENEAIASKLRRIADLLEYQGVAFKPAAYRRAAQTIEDLTQDIAEITDRKILLALPGIGEAIADKILEYIKTGEMSALQKLEAETSMGATALLGIDDLGPARVRQLEHTLNIRTIPQLIQAAEAGKLRKLPRFSELLEKKILENARRAHTRAKRYPLAEIESDVKHLLALLRKIPQVEKAEAAGSFRRRSATVGDVDILLAVEKPSDALIKKIDAAIRKLSIVERVVATGETRIAFDLQTGLRVDIRIVKLSEWGSALLYFTGSKEHNIALRRRAIERGLKLSEYGLFRGDEVIASKTEEDVYQALDLPFIEPPKRIGDLPNESSRYAAPLCHFE